MDDFLKKIYPERAEEIDRIRENAEAYEKQRKAKQEASTQASSSADDYDDYDNHAIFGVWPRGEEKPATPEEELKAKKTTPEEEIIDDTYREVTPSQSKAEEPKKTTPEEPEEEKKSENPSIDPAMAEAFMKLLASQQKLNEQMAEQMQDGNKKKEKKKHPKIKKLAVVGIVTIVGWVTIGHPMVVEYRSHQAELEFLEEIEDENAFAVVDPNTDSPSSSVSEENILASDDNTYLFREVAVDPGTATFENVAETYGVSLSDLEENNEDFSTGTAIIPYLVDNDVLQENINQVDYDGTQSLREFAQENEVSMQTLEYLNPDVTDGTSDVVRIPNFEALSGENRLGRSR